MNKKILFIIILTGLLFLCCKSVPQSHEKIALNGMIYDTENKPVVNYHIYIDGVVECTSDIGGRFLIEGISKGEHLFSGWREGYLSIKDTITIYDKSQILYIRVPTLESRFYEAFELIKKSNYGKAEECISEVLESENDNEDALYFMSVIKHLQNQNEECNEYLEKIKTKGGTGYAEELKKIFMLQPSLYRD